MLVQSPFLQHFFAPYFTLRVVFIFDLKESRVTTALLILYHKETFREANVTCHPKLTGINSEPFIPMARSIARGALEFRPLLRSLLMLGIGFRDLIKFLALSQRRRAEVSAGRLAARQAARYDVTWEIIIWRLPSYVTSGKERMAGERRVGALSYKGIFHQVNEPELIPLERQTSPNE